MKEDTIFNSRREIRFLIPNEVGERIGDVLPELTQQTLLLDGGCFPVTENIYFGNGVSLNQGGLVRTRRYLSNLNPGAITIADQDVVHMEIKGHQQDRVTKDRLTTTYETVLRILNNPLGFLNYLQTSTESEFDPALLKMLFTEFDFEALEPLLGIVYERSHFHPIESDLQLRLTLDKNIHYYAFIAGKPNSALVMGTEGMMKGEVKYSPETDQLTVPIIEKLTKEGAIPIGTLQGKVEAQYRETVKLLPKQTSAELNHSEDQSEPLHSLLGWEMTDELEGEELEKKFELTPQDPSTFLEIVASYCKSGLFGDVELVPGMESVSFWTYYFDNYGYRDAGSTLEEAFVIVRHPRKPKYFIKIKGKKEMLPTSANGQDQVMSRPEEMIKVNRTYDSRDLGVIKSIQESRLGKPVEYVGTTRRKKFYLFLHNRQSGRYYNLSADFCQTGEHKTLSQAELEYKGINPNSEPGDRTAILDEMGELSGKLKELPLVRATDTTRRKFDWLVENLENHD
ncbi:MAG: VTC domain-containing protein [bacterium]